MYFNGTTYILDITFITPTKASRWLFDFLMERVIRVKVDGFLASKIYLKAGIPQGSVMSPLLFLVYVDDMPHPKHHLKLFVPVRRPMDYSVTTE